MSRHRPTRCWMSDRRSSRQGWWTRTRTPSTPATARTRPRPGWPESRTRAAGSCARWRPRAPRFRRGPRGPGRSQAVGAAGGRNDHGGGQVRIRARHGGGAAPPADHRPRGRPRADPGGATFPGRPCQAARSPGLRGRGRGGDASGGRRRRTGRLLRRLLRDAGFFTVEEADRILEAASTAGAGDRLHADQLQRIGATALAVRLGATSADHLEQLDDEGVAILAGSADGGHPAPRPRPGHARSAASRAAPCSTPARLWPWPPMPMRAPSAAGGDAAGHRPGVHPAGHDRPGGDARSDRWRGRRSGPHRPRAI